MMQHILLVVSEFNRNITRNLAKGAITSLEAQGYNSEQIEMVWVPGAFELPLIAAKAAKYGRYQAIICLGCVIRGETPHFDYVCQEAARGIMEVGLKAELPVIFGVLTVDNMDQALARSQMDVLCSPLQQREAPHKQQIANKGVEAAEAAVKMIQLMHRHPGRWHKGQTL